MSQAQAQRRRTAKVPVSSVTLAKRGTCIHGASRLIASTFITIIHISVLPPRRCDVDLLCTPVLWLASHRLRPLFTELPLPPNVPEQVVREPPLPTPCRRPFPPIMVSFMLSSGLPLANTMSCCGSPALGAPPNWSLSLGGTHIPFSKKTPADNAAARFQVCPPAPPRVTVYANFKEYGGVLCSSKMEFNFLSLPPLPSITQPASVTMSGRN